MHIGIDVDEVLASSFKPVYDHAKLKHGLTPVFEELTHHDWWLVPGCEISKEDTTMAFRDCIQTFSHNGKILPIAGSSVGISRLKDLGHTLHAITGRSEETEGAETRSWLETHFPGAFDTVSFTSHNWPTPRKKSEICLTLGIGHMVEDNMDFALDMLGRWVRIYLLEKPWNKLRPETHPNLIRLSSWEAFPFESLT